MATDFSTAMSCGKQQQAGDDGNDSSLSQSTAHCDDNETSWPAVGLDDLLSAYVAPRANGSIMTCTHSDALTAVPDRDQLNPVGDHEGAARQGPRRRTKGREERQERDLEGRRVRLQPSISYDKHGEGLARSTGAHSDSAGEGANVRGAYDKNASAGRSSPLFRDNNGGFQPPPHHQADPLHLSCRSTQSTQSTQLQKQMSDDEVVPASSIAIATRAATTSGASTASLSTSSSSASSPTTGRTPRRSYRPHPLLRRPETPIAATAASTSEIFGAAPACTPPTVSLTRPSFPRSEQEQEQANTRELVSEADRVAVAFIAATEEGDDAMSFTEKETLFTQFHQSRIRAAEERDAFARKDEMGLGAAASSSGTTATDSMAIPPLSSFDRPERQGTPPVPSSSAVTLDAPLVQPGSLSSNSTITSSAHWANFAAHRALQARLKRFKEAQGDYKPGGYARVKSGDLLNHGRYEVLHKLGVGHFGTVWLCWDRIEGMHVAIKFVRSDPKYVRAALIEDKTLTILQGPTDERKDYLVQFYDSFELITPNHEFIHVCLVFEVLGMSLLEVLRQNDFHGFPIRMVKRVAKQLLLALSYLHSLDIIHTDIKPDNILIAPPRAYMEPFLTREVNRVRRLERERIELESTPIPPQPGDPPGVRRNPRTGRLPVSAMPGVSEESRRLIEQRRAEYEARRWDVTPSYPIMGECDFMKGRRIAKRPGTTNCLSTVELSHGMSMPKFSAATSTDEGAHVLEKVKGDRVSRSHPAPIATDGNPSIGIMTSRAMEDIHTDAFALRQTFDQSLPTAKLPQNPYIRAMGVRPDFQMMALGLADFQRDEDSDTLAGANGRQHAELCEDADIATVHFVSRHSRQGTACSSSSSANSGFRGTEIENFTTTANNSGNTTLASSPDVSRARPIAVPVPIAVAAALARQNSGPSTSSGTSGCSSSLGTIASAAQDSPYLGTSSPSVGTVVTSPLTLPAPLRVSAPLHAAPSAQARNNPNGLLQRTVSLSSSLASLSVSEKGSTSDNSPARLQAKGSIGCFDGRLNDPTQPVPPLNAGIKRAKPPNVPAVSTSNSESGYTSLSELTNLTVSEQTVSQTGTKGVPSAVASTPLGAFTSSVHHEMGKPSQAEIRIKLADFGNALFYSESLSQNSLPEFVCTRQYRPPENIIGASFDHTVDIWSAGCTIYELLTGDLLFNPLSKPRQWSKEDDLLGQQIEMLGKFTQQFALSGRKSGHYFTRGGKLIRLALKPCGLYERLTGRYKMPSKKAKAFCDFLLRMLQPNPSNRAKADEMLQHPWLSEEDDDDDLVLYRPTHRISPEHAYDARRDLERNKLAAIQRAVEEYWAKQESQQKEPNGT